MNDKEEYCNNCGNLVDYCRCEEHTRHKRMFIFGIGSIVIGILGYLIAFVI